LGQKSTTDGEAGSSEAGSSEAGSSEAGWAKIIKKIRYTDY
jgi:hypothetical protein